MQVVIALVITTDGFRVAYEVMDGDTSDKTALKAFLSKIEAQYGRAKRTWIMDRGIPTEDDLAEMRNADADPLPRRHAAGTTDEARESPRRKTWQDVRESVRVKLVEDGDETR
jgi:hypothetical protein